MEEEHTKVKEENTELRKTILKLRTIHQMRDIATRATYEKRLRKLTVESASVHKDLWGTREDTEKKEMLLRRELLNANTMLTAANMELDQMRKDLELQTKNKAALVQWKVAKSAQLAELEAKVKKYERWSSVDVDKLLTELGRKDNEIRNLSGLESRANRQAELNEANQTRELKRLKRNLAQEKKLKEQALVALDAAKGGRGLPADLLDRGGATSWSHMDNGDLTGDDYEGPVTDVYLESVREELSAVTRENEIMRNVLMELGLNPPKVQRPGSSAGHSAHGHGMRSTQNGGGGMTPRPPSQSSSRMSHTRYSVGV
jgi:hypothetical protein